jgi:hypothetical protein
LRSVASKMQNQNRCCFQKSGFALVATLLLLTLLVALVLILLGVVRLESTSTQNMLQVAQARHNALSSLEIALGELQEHTGPDTRVTAPADIYDDNFPDVVGAWKSWEGLNHEPSNGRPVPPDYNLKDQAISDSGDGRFITWLVSGAVQGQNIADPSNLLGSTAVFDPGDPSADGTTAPLLSEGSLGGGSGREVHVPLQWIYDRTTNDKTGAYAWWVSPENQKARVVQPYSPRSPDESGWAELAQSHSTPDPSVFGLDELEDDPEDYNPDSSSAPKPGSKILNLPGLALLKAILGSSSTVEPQEQFHDFSKTSVGLLTNTATGGWRKDLSILTEKWNQIYAADTDGLLPLFRYFPDPDPTDTDESDTSLVPMPGIATYDIAQSNFYPWSEYFLFGATSSTTRKPIIYNAASASWQSLVNYATKYQHITYDTGTKTASAAVGWEPIISSRNSSYVFSNNDFYRHYHDPPPTPASPSNPAKLNPVIARIQFIVQANALPDPNPSPPPSYVPANNHRVNLRIVPIFTLWNPYNVELVHTQGFDTEFAITTLRSLPLTLSITNNSYPPSGGADAHYQLLTDGRGDAIDGGTGQLDTQISGLPAYYAGHRDVGGWLPLNFTLKPGEVKIFSAQSDSPYDTGNNKHHTLLLLEEGSIPGGAGIPLIDPDSLSLPGAQIQKILDTFIKVPADTSQRPNNELHAGDEIKFSVRADRLTKIFTNAISTKSGAGAFFAVGTHKNRDGRTNYASNKNLNHMRSVIAVNVDQAWAQDYWPEDELVELEIPVSELVDDGSNPPWTNLFTVSFGPRISFSAAGDSQNRPTKGLVQNNPIANNAFSVPETTPSNHPANSPYDFSYFTFFSGDPYTPTPGIHGYIATGFQDGDGLSRLIMAEIPLRPMASLVELQHWNVRGANPFPPHQYNLIGNSDATPFILQDDILPEDPSSPGSPVTTPAADNLQHDDAYCANHLLFDDWFFSSIAQQPAEFGSDPATDVSIQDFYVDYLLGNEQLTNRAYKRIGEDKSFTSTSDTQPLVNDVLNSADGWMKVASRFEVEGMFNVNSTSIEAWRALLGHARDRQVAYHSATGMDLATPSNDYVASRGVVATDIEAGASPATGSGSGASFDDGSEITGFRTLTDAQLDELAALVVEEIRARGPFLSLSEFINRQLSSDDNLALAGALQTALNNLTDDPLAALKDSSKQFYSETMSPSDPKLSGVGYAFEPASAGVYLHGFPGWIRQADILRPIAPILSARDDTFTIRTYGDARDPNGNIVARAWCEAIVQRSRDYVNPSADEADSIDTPTSAVNRQLGRKYIIKSFRWLNRDEV